jgi:hypothetical protein
MVVVVVASFAIVFAKGIQHTVIDRWDGVHDAFFYECLQRAIDGYPIKSCRRIFLYVSVRQSTFASQKQFQNLLPAFGYAKPVVF